MGTSSNRRLGHIPNKQRYGVRNLRRQSLLQLVPPPPPPPPPIPSLPPSSIPSKLRIIIAPSPSCLLPFLRLIISFHSRQNLDIILSVSKHGHDFPGLVANSGSRWF